MSAYMNIYDYTPDLLGQITKDIGGVERELIVQIIGLFAEAGLPVKVKLLFPQTPNAYFRVLCHIKKSAEAVIINTRNDLGKEGVVDGVHFQLRITNKNTLEHLEVLSPSVRDQIVNADDCRFCSEKCNGKRYVFSFDGITYTKCQYLCSNFRITVKDDADAESVLAIIRGELENRKLPKK